MTNQKIYNVSLSEFCSLKEYRILISISDEVFNLGCIVLIDSIQYIFA